MIVSKRKSKRKIIFLSSMAGVLALCITLAIVLNAVLLGGGAAAPETEKVELWDGEDYYGNMPIAYTRVPEAKMLSILVTGEKNNYYLKRKSADTVVDKDGNKTFGPFYISSFDEDGNEIEYMPEIANPKSPNYDPTFDYESLYATVSDDAMGTVPKITYLCTAIGTPYFDQRITLPEDAAERERALSRYGLNGDKTVKIFFSYVNDAGEEKKHEIIIGEPMITGVGFYFMVDGRDHVYSVETNNYFRYAMANFVSFIKPTLTAAGLAMDNAFEPYLTTDFKQYANTLYDNDGYDNEGNWVGNPDIVGYKKDKNNNLILIDYAKNGYKVVVDAAAIKNKKENSTGYQKYENESVEFDFNLKDNYSYGRLINQLLGKPVGKLDSAEIITLYTYSNRVDLEGKTSLNYEYTITKIESLLLEDREIVTVGESVKDSAGNLRTNLIKVSYTAKVDGKAISENPMHAVLDITSVPDSAARAALECAAVGELTSAISFSVDYCAKDASTKQYLYPKHDRVRMIITDIIAVVDADGKSVSYATDGTKVMYRYVTELNGVLLDGESTAAIEMKAGLTGTQGEVYKQLKGRSQSVGLKLVFLDEVRYSEIFADFITYEVREIKYCVESEQIVSFRYQQASNRDPFYGESLYENTLTNEHKMYGLNASACEAVVKMLGGITSNSATKSEGLSGFETVAVGITPELMYDLGLYAYTVYFELPRGIKNVAYDSNNQTHQQYLDSLDDYTCYGKLGFMLHVSEEYPDGTRYVASESYGVIVKIDSAKFEFLNYGFTDFYARRNLVLTNISNIEYMKMEFFMDDVRGSYKSELNHKFLWYYNGKAYTMEELEKMNLTEAEMAIALKQKRDTINVINYLDTSLPYMETEFSKAILAENRDFMSLYEFYDKQTVDGDTLGTANFREFVELLFYSYYEGNMTEAEQAEALDGAKMLMRMSVKLGKWSYDGEYDTDGAFEYVYEFYRVSDRQVIVKMYNTSDTEGTTVSDFYISTFTFKKIVSAYHGILNKINIENDNPYDDSYIK